MFGESESESPRVPSPWDTLISTPPSPGPKSRVLTPSPLSNVNAEADDLAVLSVPRLVAESDDGNVEYKLQLLNPTPARFARLVTQLKWRLLEGGGQAYYELGVADSGDLVGLPRDELEQSLETLEMMAGEIGASVIVVKEIEIPAALAKFAKRTGDCRRGKDEDEDYSSSALSSFSNSDVDLTDDGEELTSTVLVEKQHLTSGVFVMDPDSDTDSTAVPRYSIDLEISTVFKPRPVRTKQNTHNHPLVGGKSKRSKKSKVLPAAGAATGEMLSVDPKYAKSQNRRQTRDRKRDEKKKALMTLAAQTLAEGAPAISAPIPTVATVEESIVTTLENLDLDTDQPPTATTTVVVDTVTTVTEVVPVISIVADEDDDDVFPTTAKQPAYPKFAAGALAESHLDFDPTAIKLAGGALGPLSPSDIDDKPRLIVEALVVRKMSLEEAFLDFEGFGIT